MVSFLQRNSIKFCLMFVLIWTTRVHGSNTGLIQLNNLWKSRESIGNLPASSQKIMLKMIGEVYAKQNITHCNVFGGVESCSSISDYSNYTKSCDSKGKLVDCVFETDISRTTLGNPSLVLQQYAGTQDKIDCADCHEKFEKFFCAVTAPSCGTVDKVLDEIPSLISSVASKKSSTTISLQRGVLQIIQAASLGFPCKMMCEAVMEACGCPQQPTFGEVMDVIEIGSQSSAITTMRLSIKELFHLIWDEHVCDIFSEGSVPGFSGVCVSYLDGTSKCDLCNGVKRMSSIQKEVVRHGVQQLSQMVLRLLQGGLEEILLAMDNPTVVNSHVDQANRRKTDKHTGAVAIVVVFVAFMVLTFVASIRMSRNRQFAYQYVDLSSMGYTPPIL